MDAQEVLFAVNAYNGNSALLQQAYDSHSSLLEVYPTNGAEWQMVVGTGVKTLLTIHEQESGKPIYVFGNGDGTVPVDSAAMGNVQPSAVHYACFAEHGKMAGAKQVIRVINAFLLRGDPLKGRATPCPVS